MKNRREFLQKSVLGIAGVLTAPTWLQGAPALIKSLGKPKSGHDYSTVTDFAKFLGLSTSNPLNTPM